MDDTNLTPTEGIIIDLLTARIRLGEQVWTVENRLLSTLRRLSNRGIITHRGAPVEHAQLIWFTDEAYTRYITASTYIPPILRNTTNS